MTHPNPHIIQPQPAPETWMTDTAPATDGQQLVVIRIRGVSGEHVSFMSADAATRVAEQIIATAQRACTGLLVAPIDLMSRLKTIEPNGHQDPP